MSARDGTPGPACVGATGASRRGGPGAAVAAGLALGLLLAAGCGRFAGPPPVAAVSLDVDPPVVALGSLVELTFRFEPAADLAPLGGDYVVFVHVLDEAGRLLWAADHDPPRPTSQWAPGRVVQYVHRVRAPVYPYIGEATIAAGLYAVETGARLVLAGDDLGGRAYRVGTIRLEPRRMGGVVSYEDGWHDIEGGLVGTTWRWTTGRARVSFRRPSEAVRLILDVEGRPDLFDRPQRLSLVRGDRVLRAAVLDTPGPTTLGYMFSAAELGADDPVQIDLQVDRTFVPMERESGSFDDRELGVRVFTLLVDPH